MSAPERAEESAAGVKSGPEASGQAADQHRKLTDMQSGAAPLAPAPGPESEPELLESGPGRNGPPRRTLPMVLGVAALVVAALLAWQFWPRPIAPISLTELQGIYAGMVRGDGTNDASLMQRKDDADPWTVTPAGCAPLFDTTAFDQYPADAVDGVGTYWLAARVGTSLFTYRFADADLARRAYDRIDTALTTCEGQQVRVAQPLKPTGDQTVEIARTPVTFGSGVRDQLGYQYGPDREARFAVHVLRFENTISWQFRYDTAVGDYSPLPAQQMMDSLVAQTRSVIDLRT